MLWQTPVSQGWHPTGFVKVRPRGQLSQGSGPWFCVSHEQLGLPTLLLTVVRLLLETCDWSLHETLSTTENCEAPRWGWDGLLGGQLAPGRVHTYIVTWGRMP